MALGSTQPLTEMSTRNTSGGKGGRCVRLTTYHHYSVVVKKSGSLNSPRPLWACMDCNGCAFLNGIQFACEKGFLLVEVYVGYDNPGFNVTCTSCMLCYQAN